MQTYKEKEIIKFGTLLFPLHYIIKKFQHEGQGSKLEMLSNVYVAKSMCYQKIMRPHKQPIKLQCSTISIFQPIE